MSSISYDRECRVYQMTSGVSSAIKTVINKCYTRTNVPDLSALENHPADISDRDQMEIGIDATADGMATLQLVSVFIVSA